MYSEVASIELILIAGQVGAEIWLAGIQVQLIMADVIIGDSPGPGGANVSSHNPGNEPIQVCM